LGAIPAVLTLPSIIGCGSSRRPKDFPAEERATVYRATDPDPQRAMRRLVDSLGGIDKIIDQNDIVILKPNTQWWYQGMTNTDCMAEFIQMILERPGFDGEIIVADNNQSVREDSRGWTTEHRNGRFNFDELVAFFHDEGHVNVTKYRWHPAGPNPDPLQFAGSGDSVRKHVSEGDGYIWPEDLYYVCPHGNRCVLAYPVFTSSYSGATIDLKNGAFKDGDYTGQPVKFINFAAMNHHSKYAGITAAVKNFMGVVDMSCGYPAPYPEGTYNTHHVGASGTFRWMARNRKTLKKTPGFHEIYEHPSIFRFRYTGGVLGAFMKHVRRADLNIITAVTIGWGARIDPAMAYRADTVLASTDPVALDYWAAANIMLPATKKSTSEDYYIRHNDSTRKDGVLFRFLEECRRELGGTTNPDLIAVVES
jgi:hypothetical protein